MATGTGNGVSKVKERSGHTKCAACVLLHTVAAESPEITRRHAPVLVPSSTQIAPPGWIPLAGCAVRTDVGVSGVT